MNLSENNSLLHHAQRVFLFLFFTLTFLSSEAATFKWLGGTGSWFNPYMWDQRSVPTVGDEVFIDGGHVIIGGGRRARASVVHVQQGILRIRATGELHLSEGESTAALVNHGIVRVQGLLSISEHRGMGLDNYGTVVCSSGSEFLLFKLKDHAIRNEQGAFFQQDGLLQVFSTDGHGIYNRGSFQNSSEMELAVSENQWNSALKNIGEFFNENLGLIEITSGYYGLDQSPLAVVFENAGKINITGTEAAGFYSGDNFENLIQGSIYLDHVTMNVRGTLENFGSISILGGAGSFNNGFGLWCDCAFENHGYMYLSETLGTGFRIAGSNSLFNNSGQLHIMKNTEKSIEMSNGNFRNMPSGYVYTDSKLDGHEILNLGIFISDYKGNHSCDLENRGAFNDIHGALEGTANVVNNGAIVDPIEGPLSAGQIVQDALNLGDLSGISVDDWETSPYNGLLAGIYDENRNEFTANANSVLRTKLYAYVELMGSNNGASMVIQVHNKRAQAPGAYRYAAVEPTDASRSQQEKLSKRSELKIYPNPASNYLNVNTNKAEKIRIMALDGRTVQMHQEGIKRFDISQLSPGMYTLQVAYLDGSYAHSQFVKK